MDRRSSLQLSYFDEEEGKKQRFSPHIAKWAAWRHAFNGDYKKKIRFVPMCRRTLHALAVCMYFLAKTSPR